MHRVGGGVPVGDQQAALAVVFAPVLLVGGVAVHRVEGGGGIGVHIVWVAAEGAAQIQADQRRRFLAVPGEGQAAEGDALLFQGLAQQLCLRGLAGTVGPLKYDQLSHNACLLCMVIRISLYHHFTRL